MNAGGFHLTHIGEGNILMEPGRAADVSEPDVIIEDILACFHGKPVGKVFYDLSDVHLIDPIYLNWLNYLGRACRTMGIRLVCINMQPAAAFALAGFLIRDPEFDSALDIRY